MRKSNMCCAIYYLRHIKAATKAVNLVLSGVSHSQLMVMSPVSIIEHWLLDGCIKISSSALTNAILLA